MTDMEKLITAARSYCINNFRFWVGKYSQENKSHRKLSDNDYNLYSRFQIIRVIQQEVETLVGLKFTPFEICKQELVEMGKKSYSIGLTNRIAQNAMNEEREKFIKFVNSRTTENVSEVEPLPYRRRLTSKEMLSVRKKLLELWNFDGGYWNPLEDQSPKETVFLMQDNLTDEDCAKIADYLISTSGKRLYEVTEDRIDHEMEFDSFDINLHEAIIADKTFEWVIYGSHEGTLAFGGTALVGFIKSLFADRQDKLNKWE